MKSLLCGIAALPFLATVAVADPVQLSSNQMDQVTAGWQAYELDVYNSGVTEIGVYLPVQLVCPATATGCISTPTIQLWWWKPAFAGDVPFPPAPPPGG